MDEEIGSCPFCGEAARVASCTQGERNVFVPVCSKCGAMIKPWPAYFVTEQEAINAWNNRIQKKELSKA
jgi:Lar family restriction alleviation protein